MCAGASANHLHVLAGVAENLKTTQFMLFNRASSSKHNASDHMGCMDCGELTLASQLQGLDHSLTVFDRAYFSAAFLLDWQTQGASRHWLMRAKRAFGAAVAFGFGDRSAGWLMLLGGVLMLAGVVLHLAESHGHEHTHEVLEHEYAQVAAFARFFMTNTPFATKHGVKGDEFETVLVVLDDSGAAWNFYSFDKYLSGADDAANPERANRSRNVFYVCCSRARQRLAVIDMGKASAAKTARMQALFGADRCFEV